MIEKAIPDDRGTAPGGEDAIENVFRRLAASAFRRRFRLAGPELALLRARGPEVVLPHAHELIGARLAPAKPPRDGKQTPMRGHPVFLAQHATGTCCRGCLMKWHSIPRGRALTTAEQDYVVAVIGEWLRRQEQEAQPAEPEAQLGLGLADGEGGGE